MSRYQPLADFLAGKKAVEWDASFAEIEERLGFPLPKSAYTYPAWWANQAGPGHSQTRGWRSVGWRTRELDLKRRRVRFERERPTGPERAIAEADEREALARKAQELTGIADREKLMIEALRALVEREAARRLARLGGTIADLEAPPRRRFG
jgi:hypothetical protein